MNLENAASLVLVEVNDRVHLEAPTWANQGAEVVGATRLGEEVENFRLAAASGVS